MKILFIVDEFPSISTPFILNQMVGIIDNGHDLEILARYKGSLDKVHEEIEKYNFLDKTTFLSEIENSKSARLLFFIKKFWKLFQIKNSIYYLRSFNVFKFGRDALSLRLFHETEGVLKMKERSFDIIHGQFGPLGKLTLKQRKIGALKGKIITQFRGYDISKLIAFERKNYYSDIFKEGDWFLANCHFFKQKAIELGAPKNKISVQYSGIQINKFNKGKEKFNPTNPIKIITVARLSPKKGIIYIIKSMKLLKEKGIDFHYSIIGDGELKQELEQVVKVLGLEQTITFVGKQNHTYIIDELPKYDLFITHNITADNGDQDAPINSIKEAMLLGLPVIATNHGGIPEMIIHKKNGYLVDERSETQIVEAIEYVLNNKQDVEKWVEEGKQSTIALFDNNKLNQQLIKFYENVMSR